MKLLCLVIFGMHWYNPGSWILFRFYSLFSEYMCDAKATEKCSCDEKKTYAELLVFAASAEKPLPAIWKNNFSNSEKNLKRRIHYIMHRPKISKFQSALLAIICIIAIFASSSSVLAYQPVEYLYGGPYSENADWVVIGDDIPMPEGYNTDFSLSDTVIVWDDGTQLPVSDKSVIPRAFCFHTYKTGTMQEHVLNKSGGCTVTLYKVTSCGKCGYIKSKSQTSATTFNSCPHK